MKKTFILTLLLILIIGSFAQAPEDEGDTLSIIKKIEKSEFGMTLLDTIQLQMEASDSVQDLINLLRRMEDDLVSEQKKDDVLINSFQEECDGKLVQLQDEIQTATKRITELGNQLALKIPERDTKIAAKEQQQKFLQMILDELTALDARKEIKVQEWQSEQDEHNKATVAISQAKDIIVTAMKNQQSFLQTSANKPFTTAFVQMGETLTSTIKSHNYKRKSWTKIFSMLANIASSTPIQADQSAVDKVISICDDILNKIADSREIERRDFEHWMNEYNNVKNGQLDKKQKSEEVIASLTSQIDTLIKHINMATAEKESQEQKVQQKTTEHGQKLQLCDDENRAYSERRQSRDDRKEVVSDAVGLLQSKLRTFRKYVNERTSSISKKAF